MRKILLVALVVLGSGAALVVPAFADTQGPGVGPAVTSDWSGGGGGVACPVPAPTFGPPTAP